MGNDAIKETQQTEQEQIKTKVVANASGQVSSSIDNVLGNTSSILEILKKYSFIKKIDGFICADFSGDIDNENIKLISFIEDLAKNNYYIKDLSKNFNLNDLFDKDIKEGEQIILGSGYGEILDNELYYIASPGKDGSIGMYQFMKNNDEGKILGIDMDKFLMNLYKHGIHYGYDLDAIEKGFRYLKGEEHLNNSMLQIAKASEPIHGINAKLLGVSSKIKEDTRSEGILLFGVDSQKSFDIKTYVNTTFDVEEGELLHLKVPLKKGKNGFKVNGEKILTKEGIDLENLEEKFLEGFEILNMPGKKLIELLISDDKNYKAEKVAEIIIAVLYIEDERSKLIIRNHISKNFGMDGEKVLLPILKKFNIDPETIVNIDIIKSNIAGTYQAKDSKSFVILENLEKKIINKKTGNIHKVSPDKDFTITGEEDRDSKGLIIGIEQGYKISGEYRTLRINGNVYGNIHVSGKTEVIIEGNLAGGSKIIHKGDGKISIVGMISADSIVDAKNSEVHIGNLANGTILAKNLYIKNISQGKVLAKNLYIENIRNKDSNKLTIIGESIHIKDLENNGLCKAIILSETIDPEKIKNIKRAAELEIETEDRKIEFILNSPELKSYYKTIVAYKHNFPIFEKFILQIIARKGDASTENVRQEIRKLKLYLAQLEEHIKKVNKKTELIDSLSSNVISKADLLVDNYIGGNSIELYNYEYISKLGDIFTDIEQKELDALMQGIKVPDNIKYSKISGVVITSNFHWTSNSN